MKRKLVFFLAVILVLISFSGCDKADYKKAMELYEAGNYSEAAEIFAEIPDYEDSSVMYSACKYAEAMEYIESKDYKTALEILETIRHYGDAESKIAEAETELMFVTYSGTIEKLQKTTWFFNGGSDSSLNAINFGDRTATVSEYYFDGNGKHDNGDTVCSFTIDDETITVSFESETLKIPYKEEGDSVTFTGGVYHSIEEVESEIQGYWKDYYFDYIYISFAEGEYNAHLSNGKFVYESASAAYGYSGKYYYYGPYEGTYKITSEGLVADVYNGEQWAFNIIDRKVVLLRYDNVCEVAYKLPGKRGYSF